MGVSKTDVSNVKHDLKALLLELDGMSNTTFPGADKQQRRFLYVVREWATVSWSEMTFGQAARKMHAKLPSLREVCALPCAQLHYCKPIHSILRSVENICVEYQQAVAQQAAQEEALAAAEAAYRAGVKACAAEDARRARVGRMFGMEAKLHALKQLAED